MEFFAPSQDVPSVDLSWFHNTVTLSGNPEGGR